MCALRRLTASFGGRRVLLLQLALLLFLLLLLLFELFLALLIFEIRLCHLATPTGQPRYRGESVTRRASIARLSLAREDPGLRPFFGRPNLRLPFLHIPARLS